MTDLLYIRNQTTGKFARHDSVGEHDGKLTEDLSDAKSFEHYRDASDYSQNFGPDFSVVDVDCD